MACFPIYLLDLSGKLKVVFPKDKQDIGHVDIWEQTVSAIVARHYKIPQAKLVNIPYCQRRARIVGNAGSASVVIAPGPVLGR